MNNVDADFIMAYDIRGCIQKFPDWVDNEINNHNKKTLVEM
jgi:hypothetical protein